MLDDQRLNYLYHVRQGQIIAGGARGRLGACGGAGGLGLGAQCAAAGCERGCRVCTQRCAAELVRAAARPARYYPVAHHRRLPRRPPRSHAGGGARVRAAARAPGAGRRRAAAARSDARQLRARRGPHHHPGIHVSGAPAAQRARGRRQPRPGCPPWRLAAPSPLQLWQDLPCWRAAAGAQPWRPAFARPPSTHAPMPRPRAAPSHSNTRERALIVAELQEEGQQLPDSNADRAEWLRVIRDFSDKHRRKCAAPRLAPWLPGCLPARLPACLPACLPAWLPACLAACLPGCLAAWLPGCLAGWLAGWLAAALPALPASAACELEARPRPPAPAPAPRPGPPQARRRAAVRHAAPVPAGARAPQGRGRLGRLGGHARGGAHQAEPARPLGRPRAAGGALARGAAARARRQPRQVAQLQGVQEAVSGPGLRGCKGCGPGLWGCWQSGPGAGACMPRSPPGTPPRAPRRAAQATERPARRGRPPPPPTPASAAASDARAGLLWTACCPAPGTCCWTPLRAPTSARRPRACAASCWATGTGSATLCARARARSAPATWRGGAWRRRWAAHAPARCPPLRHAALEWARWLAGRLAGQLGSPRHEACAGWRGGQGCLDACSPAHPTAPQPAPAHCVPAPQPGEQEAARAERLALVGRAAVSSRTAAAMEERLLRRFYLQGKAAHNKARAEERRAQRGLAKQQ
jgi:hypothetical protein